MVGIGSLDLGKRPGIVAVISDEPVESARAAKWLGADLLELRLDMLEFGSPDEMKRTIERIKSGTGLPCIATNRLQADGGKWQGSEEARIELLKQALPFIDAVDIEIAADEDLRDSFIKLIRAAGKTLIVSSHDFKSTPTVKEMKAILECSFELGADIAKLAVMPLSLQDALNLLQVTLDSGRPVCTIAMGDIGRHTRIAAPCYGSVLTYGSIGKAVAPGQVQIHQLKSALEILF
ncbi:type I 3-dehydroquinate dehydratase [Methanolobus chelungpuianus]|uniref:3-dehydroquinate dehydratase n=1 Tax=Methanolobus chelungpuianus TaxID=502115 RepID=A0AAE3KX18_9EURY|nr:type I 3-dehydroquinate dehydratase [Methanolobus chelungpuianus]MCQ6961834.1 3-dehydroquinate dehydratase [Methanolobus chelungpuianus]